MNAKKLITSITDKYLNWLVDMDGNKLPMSNMQPEMSDSNQDTKEEWRIWFPIQSHVTDSEIADFESYLGYKYPDSYKTFLKHKHFYELQIAEVSFCSHPINVWRGCLSDMIFNGYPREYLLDRGLVPFANYSDWGLLCFDTSKRFDIDEYSIALWDHELPLKAKSLYQGFTEMLIAIDKENEGFS